MRHRLDLRMQYRMIDEPGNALRLRRGHDGARKGDLVAADIRANVIDRPRPGRGPGERAASWKLPMATSAAPIA